MLLLSPLVACGVPKRGGQTKYPRKTSEFGDSTAGCHGERNISQETHAREQALHYLWGAWGQPSTLEGLWGPFGCGSAGRKGGTAVKGEQGWYPYIENRLANLIYKCNKDVGNPYWLTQFMRFFLLSLWRLIENSHFLGSTSNSLESSLNHIPIGECYQLK